MTTSFKQSDVVFSSTLVASTLEISGAICIASRHHHAPARRRRVGTYARVAILHTEEAIIAAKCHALVRGHVQHRTPTLVRYQPVIGEAIRCSKSLPIMYKAGVGARGAVVFHPTTNTRVLDSHKQTATQTSARNIRGSDVREDKHSLPGGPTSRHFDLESLASDSAFGQYAPHYCHTINYSNEFDFARSFASKPNFDQGLKLRLRVSCIFHHLASRQAHAKV